MKFIDFFLLGLHCSEGQACQVFAALSWPLPGQAISQGTLSNRGETDGQSDDARA